MAWVSHRSIWSVRPRLAEKGLGEELSGAPDSLVDYAQVGGALAQQRAAEESAQRLSLRGSGDRSERIRTYNAPHDRVTDHRCHVTSPGVPRVLGGEIEVFVDALIQQDAEERVAAFEAS
jgi:protein subunit release factor A